MIKETLYQKSVDILYQAYMNDTLIHSNCYACAVGNLICANMGYTMIGKGRSEMHWKEVGNFYDISQNPRMWIEKFCTQEQYDEDTGEEVMVQVISKGKPVANRVKREMKSTGYTVNELAQIEYAFESAPQGGSSDEYMFNGLVAVLEVLKQIHQVEDDTEEVTKFTNHYKELQLCK